MTATVGRMKLQAILRQHGILAASELRRRVLDKDQKPVLSRAQAYNLWAGKVGIGRTMMRLLHDHLGISYEELMEVDSVSKRRGADTGEGPSDD